MAETLSERARRLATEASGGDGGIGGSGLGDRMGRFAKALGLDCWSTFMILGGLVLMAMVMHPSLLTVMLMSVMIGWQFIIREVAHFEGAQANKQGHFGIRWAVLVSASILIAFSCLLMIKINWLAM